MMFTY